MKGVVLAFMAVLVVFSLAAAPGEAVTCTEIQSTLSSCLVYLNQGGEPSDDCCNGVNSLASSLQTQQERQDACSCMKSAASNYNIQPSAASSLATKCGVSVGVTIDPNIDCSQVS